MERRDLLPNAGEDLIGSATTLEEIVHALAKRGCTDLTSDVGACSTFPCGVGGFCDVYQGALPGGTRIAIKSLRFCDGPEAVGDTEMRKVLKRAARELYHWSKLQHRNVLPLLGLAIFREQISMVSEWMENGNLMSYLRLKPDADRHRLCMDVCEGLGFIHMKGMVHGDLKAANVMVSAQGVAMIADFGNTHLRDFTLGFSNTTRGASLTVRWAAPELLSADTTEVSKEADVYAYGMIMLEALTGAVPYEGKSEIQVLMMVVQKKEVPPRPNIDGCNDLWDLLKSCWSQEPSQRPNITIVKNRLQDLLWPPADRRLIEGTGDNGETSSIASALNASAIDYSYVGQTHNADSDWNSTIHSPSVDKEQPQSSSVCRPFSPPMAAAEVDNPRRRGRRAIKRLVVANPDRSSGSSDEDSPAESAAYHNGYSTAPSGPATVRAQSPRRTGGPGASPWTRPSPSPTSYLSALGSSARSSNSPESPPLPPTPNQVLPPLDLGFTKAQKPHVTPNLLVGEDGDNGEESSQRSAQTVYMSAQSPSVRRPVLLPQRSTTARIIVAVTHDAENYVVVDLTGCTDAQVIRERILSKLHIPDDLHSSFSIYRIEFGGFTIGVALDDTQLLIGCQHFSDDRGSLKFLVQHSNAPVEGEPDKPVPPPAIAPVPPMLPSLSSFSAGAMRMPSSRRPRSVSPASDRLANRPVFAVSDFEPTNEMRTHSPAQILRRHTARRGRQPSTSWRVRRRGSGSGTSDMSPVAPATVPSLSPESSQNLTTRTQECRGSVTPAPTATQSLPGFEDPNPNVTASAMPSVSGASTAHSQPLVSMTSHSTHARSASEPDSKYERNLALAAEERRREEERERWMAKQRAELAAKRQQWALEYPGRANGAGYQNGGYQNGSGYTSGESSSRFIHGQQGASSPTRSGSAHGRPTPQWGYDQEAHPMNTGGTISPMSGVGVAQQQQPPQLRGGAREMGNLRDKYARPAPPPPPSPPPPPMQQWVLGRGPSPGPQQVHTMSPPGQQYHQQYGPYVEPQRTGGSYIEPQQTGGGYGEPQRLTGSYIEPQRTGESYLEQQKMGAGFAGYERYDRERMEAQAREREKYEAQVREAREREEYERQRPDSAPIQQPYVPPATKVISRDFAVQEEEDQDDSDEDGGTLWQVPKQNSTPLVQRTATMPKGLRLRIDGTRPSQTDSSPASTQESSSGATLIAPTLPLNVRKNIVANAGPGGDSGGDVASRPPPVSHQSSHGSQSWDIRPQAEEVYEKLEQFFPNHDLDQPVIDAPPSGALPVTTEPSPATGSTLAVPVIGPGVKRHKKSIRVVAAEHKKMLERINSSKIQPPATEESAYTSDWTLNAGTVVPAASILRKRSTKMWGGRVEEVTPGMVLGTGVSPKVPETIPEGPGRQRPTFKWIKGRLIGRGSFGRVYHAMNLTTGEIIATKQVELPKTESGRANSRLLSVVDALKSENGTLRDLDHPHIVQYLGFEETADTLSIFLEYVPGGSVRGVLRKYGKFEDCVTRSFSFQVIDGLAYLHKSGILHRDIKGENILVDLSGICKISDFGLSRHDEHVYATDEKTLMQGSAFWMAPEMWGGNWQGYSAKIDIWSMGCLVLEMQTGRRPWAELHPSAVMYQVGIQRQAPPVPDDVHLTPLADDFRRKCFAADPGERPTAAELLTHPWLRVPPGWVFNGFN